MSDSWQTQPPTTCHRTGTDDQARGPYFVENVHIAEVVRGPEGPQVLPRIRPLVHSMGWMRQMLEAPGSPFAAVTHEEWTRLNRLLVEVTAERDELELRLAESEAVASSPPVDVEALASALIVPLGEHFAKKTGPRPRTAA